MAGRPHVVVIGAGFGGLACADGLADAPVDVTVIDRNNYSTFQPLLYQVATAGLNSADVAYPIRGALRRRSRIDYRWGEVTGVDWDQRIVSISDRCADGSIAEVRTEIPFDQLVVAAGGATNYFDTRGAAEHAQPLYSLDEAVAVRNAVLRSFEMAATAPDAVPEGTLTVAIVGGGATGVEVAGALVELFSKVFPADYPTVQVNRARVVLIEAADRLLGAFGEKSARNARATLSARGVEVRVGESVAEIDADGVTFTSGQRLPAHTVVWAAGVRAAPVAEVLGLADGSHGRIPVNDRLEVGSQPDVWAIGDIAEADASAAGAGDGHLPGVAQVAMQGGAYVADTIRSRAAGGALPGPFHYRDKGIMATIGRRAAVAELPFGIRLSGTPAWLAWLGLHLVFLTGLRNRASVLLNWAWNYVWWNPGARLIFEERSAEPSPDQSDASKRTGGS